MKKILDFFDKLEDKIRGRLSKYPLIYALLGSIGIILLWRGIWVIGDDLGLSGWASVVIGLLILLPIGLFVSFFVGGEIIISGIKEEKRVDEKTEEEIEIENISRYQMQKEIKEEIDEVKNEIAGVRDELEEVKEDLESGKK